MKKKLVIRLISLVMCILMLLGTVGCNITPSTPTDATEEHSHEHESECAHNWVDATCTKPKTCSLCGKTEGEAKGHSGGTATCLSKAVCDACKTEYGELAEHNYDKDAWGYTSPDGHAHLCSTPECRAHEAIVSHTPSGAATEKDPSVCTECGFIIAPALGHITHTAKPEWKKDDSGHWHDCVGCSTEKLNLAAHIYDGDCDRSCDVCGYERNVDHKFSVEKVSSVYLATEADCENAATYYKSCACGAKGTETFASGEALEHKWGNWTAAHGTHTRVCERDSKHIDTGTCSGGDATCEGAPVCSVCNNEYGTPLGHEYGEWKVTVPATCTTAGARRQSCTHDGCLAYNEEPIEATEHSYDTAVTAPTCSEQGYTTYTCKVDGCGYTYKDDYTNATGVHRWDVPLQTCTAGQHCLDCDETTDPLGHDYGESGSVAATCTAAKKVTYSCSRCTDSYEEEEGDPLGHDILNVTPTLELVEGETCLYVRHYICSRAECGADVEGDEITQHAAYTVLIKTEATCVSEGEKEFTCTACNKPVKDNEVIPVDTVAGHKWDSGRQEGSKTICSCQNDGCTATKEVVSVGKNDTVNIADVKDSELQLEGGANITLGEAADAIGEKNVSISVDSVEDKDSLGLTPEQLAQVGDNKVYDFSIKEGETPITSFGGKKITVTLPYTLKDGENVDSIAVWFIDDNGNLTSIEATYSNGCVTFETDHFSYYTVTELTPAERCALYGHSETVKEVKPTCTADGYKLTFCIRCGYSEKVPFGEALGHDYQIDTEKSTTATCISSGKTVQTCQNCNKSTTVTVHATGHSWVEADKVDATCQAAGYIEFSCENECGSTKKQVIMQLPHSMTNTVVAPTCSEMGYTEHKCENEGCDYSYKDNLTDPLGHQYSYAFEWAEDYSSAACHITCVNDGCDYAEELEITNITVIDIAPDCDSYGRYEYIARVTHNGTMLEDKQYKDYEDKSYKHNYDSEWKSDGESHWNVCKACGAVDEDSVAKHTFDDVDSNTSGHWSVCSVCGAKGATEQHSFTESERREPTCAEAGSVKLTCECGYSKTQTLSATGEHSYEGGVCKVCGKKDEGCDHKTLTEKVIDISEYGMCQKTVTVTSCECGEVVYIDEDSALLEGCDWDEVDDTLDGGVDENGNEYQTITMRCGICGAEMDLYATLEKDGCTNNIKYVIILRMGESVVFDDLRMEMSYTSHYNTETVKVDFSEYSSCGGYVYKRVCKDCGEVEYLGYDMEFNCDIPEPPAVTEKDENGVEHTIQTAVCPNCGLVYKVDTYREVKSVCEWVDHMTMTVMFGDEVIYFYTSSESDDSHEIETTYEMHGETCDDGYKIIEYCAKCDTKYTWNSDGHRTAYEEIQLEEKGVCGGYVEIEKCDVCGTITYANVRLKCERAEYSDSEYTDGDIKHHIFTESCSECGAVYTYDSWEEVVSECLRYNKAKTVLTVNGETIVDVTTTQTTFSHSYTYEAIMEGEICEDGLTVIIGCAKCDYNEVYTTAGCYYINEEYDLSELGTCGGYVNIRKCVACGEVSYANRYQDCYLQEIGETSDGFTIRECEICKAVFHTKRTETEKDENCRYEISIEEYLYIDSKYVLSYAYTTFGEDHNYQYNATMLGETCEEGLEISVSCADCDYYEPNRIYYGCYAEHTTYDLSEYGVACGGEIAKSVCIACGEVLNSYSNYHCEFEYIMDEEGSGGKGDTLVCVKCGTKLVRQSERSEKDENCNYIHRDVETLYVNGEVIFEFAEEWDAISHNFEHRYQLIGESCEDGVIVVDICTDCGYSSEGWTTYKHETYPIFTLDVIEEGFCEYHYAEVMSCACGEITSYHYYLHGDYDENGYVSCYDCALRVYEFVNEAIDGCNITSTTTFGVYNGETELYRKDFVNTYAEHSLSVDASFVNGVFTANTVCTECDFVSSFVPESVELVYDELSGEYYYDLRYSPEQSGGHTIYLMANNAPTLNLRTVAAEEDGSIKDEVFENLKPANGDSDKFFRYKVWLGSDIEYILRISFEDKQQGGEIAYIIIPEETDCSHYTESVYVLPEGCESCEDGLVEISICVRCGMITRLDMNNYHHRTYKEFNLSEYGFCDKHYVELYSCLCGENVDFYYEKIGGDYADGFHSCYDCDMRILDKSYVEEDGCTFTQNREIGLYSGDTEIYYHQSSYSYVEHDFAVDGNAVGGALNLSILCKKCGMEKSFASDTAVLVYDEARGEYYYDVTYIPEESGYYRIYLMSEGTNALEIFRVSDGKYELIYGGNYDKEDDKPIEDKPIEDKPIEDKPIEDKPIEDIPIEDKPLEDIPIEDKPVEDKPVDGDYIIVKPTEDGRLEYEMVDTASALEYAQLNKNSLFEFCESFKGNNEYVFRISFEDRQQSGEIGYVVISENSDCSHNTYSYYVLPEGADSCEDGVLEISICRACGEVTGISMAYYHAITTKYYDLSKYESCGGHIEINSCPCGDNSYINYWFNCYTDETEETVTDADGTEHFIRTLTCAECGTVYTIDEYSVVEGCIEVEHINIVMYRNDEEVINLTSTRGRTEYHEYEYNYVFDNTEGEPNCNDGVTIDMVCLNCGISDSVYYSWHHELRLERYEFEDTCNDGYLELYRCPCGESTNLRVDRCAYDHTSNTQVYEDGTTHYIDVYTCPECSLRYQEDRYTLRDDATCLETTYYTVSVSKGDAFICEVKYDTSEIVHKFVATGQLHEGAASCEDGVTIMYQCACGASDISDNIYSHVQLEVERYELTDYGALDAHAGAVVKTTCTCGAKSDIKLVDSLCEFDREWIDCWVDGYISGYVYTAENPSGYYVSNNAYKYTCAVTDPEQCTLNYRYTIYYIQIEGECRAEQWKLWQIGYNPEDGSCLKEIKVKMGNTISYHKYTVEEVYEEYESGMTKASGNSLTCPDCGSYYYDIYYYDENGNQSRHEKKLENKLEDGCSKLYSMIIEYDEKGDLLLERYDYIDAEGVASWNQYEIERILQDSYEYNGMICQYEQYKTVYTDSEGTTNWEMNERITTNQYIFQGEEHEYVLNRSETSSGYIYETSEVLYKGCWYRIHNYNQETDGYWYKYEYSYELKECCTRTERYTNSDGKEAVDGPVEWHQTYNHVYIIAPTCTQDGLEGSECAICGTMFEEYIRDPYQHQWEYANDDLYYCLRCGMENSNGADGDIVIEDLTYKYGNGESYVAGYWLRNNVEFVWNVSIMLHTPLADGNNQIILEGIQVVELEGVRALSFSKADVLAAVAAKAEELGITLTPDMYDVRFAFVPLGADESHDYAITFVEENFDITESDNIGVMLADGEKKIITITSEADMNCHIRANSYYEVSFILTDPNGETINSGFLFGFNFALAAGEVYTLEVHFESGYEAYDDARFAYIMVTIG